MIESFNSARVDRDLFFICNEDVPSFGAMEITGATVVSDNIVLSTVKWNSGTQIARVAFNGPYPVLAGRTGSCTMRYPCQARLDDTSGNFSLTTKLGLVSGSWDLEPGTGDELFMPVCLDESNAYNVDSAHRSVWIMPISADTGVKEVYIVKVTTEVSARSGTTPGSGVGDVHSSLSGSFVTDTPTGLDLYNSYESVAAVDEYVVAVRNGVDDKFYVIPPPGEGGGPPTTAKRIRGTIKQYPLGPGADFTDATAGDPHTLENIEGIDAVWSGASELDIYNPELFKLWNQDTQDGLVCSVRCEYNETTDQWEVYSARADRILHGARRADCKFQELDGRSGWDDWIFGKEVVWVEDVYQLGCYLYVKKCGTDAEQFAEINFVDRVFWDASSCGIKYELCDGARYSVGEPRFVTDVYQVGCYLYYNKCGETSAPFAEVNFIDRIVWDTETCSLVYEFCDGTTSTVDDMPNFVTNVEYNGSCNLYVEFCRGEFEFYELDFVTDVALSADFCHLVVTKCVSGDTEIEMPYVTRVYVVGDEMNYDTGCSKENFIIAFTTCPE